MPMPIMPGMPFWSDGIRDKGQPSELTPWGIGLTHPHLAHALPEYGGYYCGLTPRMGPEGPRSGRYHPPGRLVRG